jgi:hypothetical protein
VVPRKKKTMRKPGPRPRQILGNLVEISNRVLVTRFTERELEDGGIEISPASRWFRKGARGIAVERRHGNEYMVLIDGGLYQISSKHFDVIPAA